MKLDRNINGTGPVATLDAPAETEEQRARRLFDEMARNIGREAVNHLKTMYPHIFTPEGKASKSWETSLVNTVRNDINYRMRPLLEGLVAYSKQTAQKGAGQ
jgi:hypothetical protein